MSEVQFEAKPTVVKAPIRYQTLSYDRQTPTSPSDSVLCPIGLNPACVSLIRHKTSDSVLCLTEI